MVTVRYRFETICCSFSSGSLLFSVSPLLLSKKNINCWRLPLRAQNQFGNSLKQPTHSSMQHFSLLHLRLEIKSPNVQRLMNFLTLPSSTQLHAVRIAQMPPTDHKHLLCSLSTNNNKTFACNSGKLVAHKFSSALLNLSRILSLFIIVLVLLFHLFSPLSPK